MTNEEKILEVLGEMNRRLDNIERTLETHKEMLEADNVALNELIRRADDAQVVVKIPFAQTAEAK